MHFLEYKFSEIPHTFDDFLKHLESIYCRSPYPLIVHIDCNFWFRTVQVYSYPLSPNDVFTTQFSKPTLFYSPSLRCFDIPFNVQEKDVYEKCLYLYYELVSLLRYESIGFINSICHKYLGIDLNYVIYKKSITDVYPGIYYLVQFIRRVLSDDSYRWFHRRLQEIANEVKGGDSIDICKNQIYRNTLWFD